ncbi:endonuclease domain-containing protein [Arsenicitalea aurantiaca]|uniref:UDP-N-acetyl-alpha-D-muramoyl-L-alanyl-L-glutamate epimerase n=1 Tax=Arsenicitalea aurantiaca TaxID=1783274 RepID=A0A433XLQ2_9HYPH|nr:endonuclease domain-containing protein [Arsenicitalea aurantiaca]RUT34944.1 endonuclease domain-containing protein [Arsenicitalea aurantiaca]
MNAPVPTVFTVFAPHFDAELGIARFGYALGDLHFEERLAFPPGWNAENAHTEAFGRILNLTALVLGVSYFKLLAPFTISAPTIGLTPSERAFILDIYENGLGEFYARNGLKRFGQIALETPDAAAAPVPAPKLAARTLLPIGGGKDSLVSVQLLESAEIPFTPFAVNPKGPILTSIEKIGLPPLYVTRTLDPEMIRLSGTPGFYNGHVPSTAINSMIASLVALLYSYDRIILSNERSASEGNVVFDGREANHQHSKSLDFERLIAGVLSDATGGGLGYFSLLRPFSEARIAAIFARETRFDRVFSSCNRNFRLSGHDGPLWCGNCPKCHFVFLILAPAMEKPRLLGIFGRNLLDDADKEAAYRELTGLAGQKPWECVGEILEAAACLYRLSEQAEWADDVIVSRLKGDLLTHYGRPALERAYEELMADSPDHLVPSSLASRMGLDAA